MNFTDFSHTLTQYAPTGFIVIMTATRTANGDELLQNRFRIFRVYLRWSHANNTIIDHKNLTHFQKEKNIELAA